MKRCSSCNIDFNTSEEYCPLCQNKLTGKDSEVVFPSNIRFKSSVLILRILAFISIVTIIITSFVELYTKKELDYTLFVIGGLFSNYIIIYFILKTKQNVLKFLERYGTLLVLITLLWYVATKNVIITNYIIPSLCLLELIINTVIAFILKNNYIINYLSLILMNVVLLIIPVILVWLKCTTFNLLSYLCLVFALIVLIGLLIFYFDEIKEVLKKVFNI